MNYAAAYTKALKYGAAEVEEIGTPRTPLSKEAQGFVEAAAKPGEQQPLLALSDYLEEHGHPLAPYIRRAATGEGEGQILHHNLLGSSHSATPKQSSVVPAGNFPIFSGLTGPSLHHSYYKLPNGHYFHLDVDADNDNRRSFLLPVSEDEVNDYISSMSKMAEEKPNSWMKSLSDSMTNAKNNPIPDRPGFDERFRSAQLPPL